MEKFSTIFYDYIHNKTDYQLQVIDKICSELEINSTIWFSLFRKRDCPDHPGTQFLDEMLPNFIFYINGEFEKVLHKYFPPRGYNIYKEPYLIFDSFEIKYDSEIGFFMEDEKELEEMLKTLTLSQKQDLMQNKLFFYIVNQTKFEIYNKRNIRALKLKSIKEFANYGI